jgi:hypothetical protein
MTLTDEAWRPMSRSKRQAPHEDNDQNHEGGGMEAHLGDRSKHDGRNHDGDEDEAASKNR